MFVPEYCTKPTLILGCGNRLLGDDGFGPAVTEYLLENYEVPEDVGVLDVGTGARRLLFTLWLSEERPRRIVLIDAVDKGRLAGEVFEIPLDEVPREKSDDFSLHQVPSSNLARELMEAGVDVRVMVCQVSGIPECVAPGLSAAVARGVSLMGDWIGEMYCRRKLQ